MGTAHDHDRVGLAPRLYRQKSFLVELSSSSDTHASVRICDVPCLVVDVADGLERSGLVYGTTHEAYAVQVCRHIISQLHGLPVEHHLYPRLNLLPIPPVAHV